MSPSSRVATKHDDHEREKHTRGSSECEQRIFSVKRRQNPTHLENVNSPSSEALKTLNSLRVHGCGWNSRSKDRLPSLVSGKFLGVGLNSGLENIVPPLRHGIRRPRPSKPRR